MCDSMLKSPISSWGHQNESSINSSGTTFSVKFMGYVPVPKSLSDRSNEEKDAFVKLCINTVITSQASETFTALRLQGDVGPFVSVYELDTFLNIANYTLTFFHIQDGRTQLLGRYMNDQMSHYKRREVDGRHYLGMIMKNRKNGNRECNVIKLAKENVTQEIIAKLQKVDNYEQTTISKLEARLRSTQDFPYKLQMLTCYHGKISHDEASRRLKNVGDFLIRESVTINGEFAMSFRTGQGTCDKFIIPANNIIFFKQFQVQESSLKNAVPRPQY
ncbi:hypothetical protein CAEBREN_16349 [Caenorhabditis brenneri]|uniref:SH2 domain-containing protein n=1 Tax=Caenorhabditis brenneri TaxID=135651 RepID=G0N1Q8_CAEBE|nr:hypothetical protein CAEBREN_16349 [Caenorhabditis brenneri]